MNRHIRSPLRSLAKALKTKSTHHDVRAKIGPYFRRALPPEVELRIGEHVTSESTYHYMTLADKFLGL